VFISLDKTIPALTIGSPSNGTTVSTSPVKVTGTATDFLSGLATVLCNGNPAVLSSSAFACDVSLANGPNTINVEAIDVAGNMISTSIGVTLGESEPPDPQTTPWASNAQGTLYGENMREFIVLQWSLNDSATEYFVYRSTSLNAPWEQTGGFSQGAARTGGAKVHETPHARLMDLCFKVEAIDAKGLVIEFYEPICVPKFPS
jgi:hypothetical protein